MPATPINYVVPTPTPITAFGGPTPTAALSPFYQPSGTRNISPTVPSYPKTALQANRIIPTSPSAFGNKNDIDDEFSAIPGVPGVDYPVFEQTPRTTFDCRQQLPGYYADVEARCQVFHICASNRTYSFLCPNGTIFSQETLVCVWWNQFDCNLAPSLYENNAFIYDYSQTGSGSFTGQQATNFNSQRTSPRQPPVYTNPSLLLQNKQAAQSTGPVIAAAYQQGVASPASALLGKPAIRTQYQDPLYSSTAAALTPSVPATRRDYLPPKGL